MDKNGLVIVLFLVFIIVFGQSDAFSYRKLVTIPDPNGSSNANQDSASSSPPPPDKTPNHTPIKNPPDLESKGLNDAHTNKDSEDSTNKKVDTGKNKDGKGSETFASKYCKKNPICNDQNKTIMACVQDFDKGSNNLTLIMQNEQDVDLKVNITFGTSMNNSLPILPLPAHSTEKVNITFSGDKSIKVILNSGNGDCELQFSQPLVKDAIIPADSPTKPNDGKNPAESPPKPNDIKNHADSPPKPNDVKNHADSPPKPNDVNNPAESPPKPNDVKNPAESPPKPKNVDNHENDTPKSKDINTPAKSEDVNVPPKSNNVDDQSKSNSTTTKNVFDQLTFYSKQVTPIHGAYLAFLVAFVIAGSWALCRFRKRRTNGGVPYQELEMGPTESSNADVETAEGWDHDWDDDDWDEDNAITSPGGNNRAKTISSNGLTSRVTKKDGWDADWDD